MHVQCLFIILLNNNTNLVIMENEMKFLINICFNMKMGNAFQFVCNGMRYTFQLCFQQKEFLWFSCWTDDVLREGISCSVSLCRLIECQNNSMTSFVSSCRTHTDHHTAADPMFTRRKELVTQIPILIKHFLITFHHLTLRKTHSDRVS